MKRRKNTPHRKIYERSYGEIPRDLDGRTYDVHHIDGNPDNNDPSNLVALSIQEHYDVHYAQGDYAACLRLTARMNKTPEEISELARQGALAQVANGKHPFQRREDGSSLTLDRIEAGTHHWLDGETQRTRQNERVANGTHQWIGDGSYQRSVQEKMIQEGTHVFLGPAINNERVKNGTHPLVGGEVQRKSNQERLEAGTHHLVGGKYQREQLKNGTHPSQVKWVCEECGKEGLGSTNYNRWHGKNCKMKK
jgi:hypothetical protein